jgi:site-specific recombinase XerD
VGEHRQHEQFQAEVVGRAALELAADNALSAQGLRRIVELFDRFANFAALRHGVERFDEVTPGLARAFVDALGVDGAEPSLAMRHLRRSAIRLIFRVARRLGLATQDPTLDLYLPPRSQSTARPLTDEEAALCRTAALHSLTSTRLAAAWALAEATARTAELSHLRVADLELDRARVWVHGSQRTEARWGRLSDWGRVQLERRVREFGGGAADSSTLLVYSGDGSAESRQASSCQAIGETLRRAGLATAPDVRPVSVAAWAGARVLADTRRIEAAARALGCRSLDAAARLLWFDWRAIEDEQRTARPAFPSSNESRRSCATPRSTSSPR